MKKFFIILILLILIVIGISVAFVSPMCKTYVNSHGEELIGRKINVEGLSLNLFNGNASLDDVTIYEHNGDSVFAVIEDIDVDMNLASLIKGDIVVEALDIDDAVVNIIQKDTTFNYDDMVEFFSKDDEKTEYSIGKLRVSDVTVRYKDRTDAKFPLVYEVRKIKAKSDNFTASGMNHVEATAKLGEKGNAEVKYDGSLADHSNMKVDLKLEDIDLKPFTPLFIRTFGREVVDGTLSLTTSLAITNGEVDGKNLLVLENPKVAKVKGLTFKPEYRHLPLKTCLYVLTDKNGRCEMDLPVTGNIDSPQFSYKRALMKCLGKALTKTVTSPIDAISSLFKKKIDEEEDE